MTLCQARRKTLLIIGLLHFQTFQTRLKFIIPDKNKYTWEN